jgi:predicted Fe-Mo cluster-binding NifX family protein
MKIAIASTGNTADSVISMFFARCEYFAIFDTTNGSLKFIANNFRKKKEHVGIEVANFMVDMGIKRIISGEFGTSIRSVTDPNKIQLVVIGDNQLTVQEIADTIKSSVNKN